MFVDIECPACQQGIIQLSPQLLAQGASFCCNQCNAKVSVANSSKSRVVKGIEAYDSYKRKLARLQQEGNNPQIM